jgi:hypothetical protein
MELLPTNYIMESASLGMLQPNNFYHLIFFWWPIFFFPPFCKKSFGKGIFCQKFPVSLGGKNSPKKEKKNSKKIKIKICKFGNKNIFPHVNILNKSLRDFSLVALPTTKALKDIVFRFIIEYIPSSSLRDFGT